MEIKFVKSERMELFGGRGLALFGQSLNRCINLGKDPTRQFPQRTGAIFCGRRPKVTKRDGRSGGESEQPVAAGNGRPVRSY